MKLTDILRSDRLSLSFEVFPPKTDSAFDSVKHATEQIAKLSFGSYDGCPPITSAEPLNTRSTVIYYYSKSKVIHTQVIHPTDTVSDVLQSLYLASDGQIWYTSENAQAPVTAEYFQGRHIINLYALN